MNTNKKAVLITLIVVILIAASLLAYNQWSTNRTMGSAPDFQATDTTGRTFFLSEFEGEIVLLHITNVENPICIECEKELEEQTAELEKLKDERPELAIITVNIRKNPYSDPGDQLAEQWWGVNVTWYWVEDHDPYPISGKYIDYWNLAGGTANPTILLIDREQQIVGVYHVYQMGRGEIDGIQTADTLDQKITQIEQGTWEGIEGEISSQKTGFLGMFALGIITSVSPCSIALLIVMLSYVMTATEREDDKEKKEKTHAKDGLTIGIAFTLGMALVFFVIGLFTSSLGGFIRISPYFYLAAGAMLIILGIHNIKSIGELLQPVRDRFTSTKTPGSMDKTSLTEKLTHICIQISKKSLFLGAFLLGIFFAIGWAPCAISLVLPVLIWMVSQNVSVLVGALMLFTFGIGHGILVIPLAVASRTMRATLGERYVKAGNIITKLFGMAIIIMGIIFAARYYGYYLW